MTPRRIAFLALCLAVLAAPGPGRAQTFSDGGPDAEAYGRSAGYPADLWRFGEVGFLVGNLSRYDRIGRTRRVPRGDAVWRFKRSEAEPDVAYTYQGQRRSPREYVERHPVTGLLVARNDTILFEHYQYGRTDKDRFLSQSMAKTVTAMLVGRAVEEGLIRSIDDHVAVYVPELADKEYGRTPIRALLHMSSGLRYVEDYGGNDDHARLNRGLLGVAPGGQAALIGEFDQRTAPPNTVFNYASIETEILGLVLTRALGRPLTEFFSERIWREIGAEADAAWGLDNGGLERAYCCITATLRDYARLARLLAFDGAWDGKQLVPRQWVIDATTAPPEKPHLAPRPGRYGYGYQVWLLRGERRNFALLGIHGQTIFVDPPSKLVLVHTAVRKKPAGNPEANELHQLWLALVARYGA
ncbi:MAG: beta-lactamase family protein [Alphaproteobacteria bacterium]|nr:beta-lactamase family protein [Alphaproteobacteria bacterium]